MLMRGAGRALDLAVDASAFSMAIHKFYTLFRWRVWGQASACWAMPLSCHATAMCECISMLDHSSSEYIFLLFLVSPLSGLSVGLFAVGRLVWEKKDPEAEMKAEGICTLTDRKEKDGAEKLRSSWVSKEKTNGKTRKENEAAPKYLHFLLPSLTFSMCFFFSWGDWQGLGKNENIFVKGWLTTGRCMLPHFPLRLVCCCNVLCPQITGRDTEIHLIHHISPVA